MVEMVNKSSIKENAEWQKIRSLMERMGMIKTQQNDDVKYPSYLSDLEKRMFDKEYEKTKDMNFQELIDYYYH